MSIKTIVPFALNPDEIEKYSLDHEKLSQYLAYMSCEVMGQPGQQHYRLLSFLSHKFNNSTIIDIGTHRGFSAIALASNKTNNVISFDILDKKDPKIQEDYDNIEFIIDNLFDNFDKYREILLNSPLIFLDIDPHDGVLEYRLYQYLYEHEYQGIIIADDINHFANMKSNFWNLIPNEYKIDITYVGHWSGTGLIRFIKSEIII